MLSGDEYASENKVKDKSTVTVKQKKADRKAIDENAMNNKRKYMERNEN